MSPNNKGTNAPSEGSCLIRRQRCPTEAVPYPLPKEGRVNAPTGCQTHNQLGRAARTLSSGGGLKRIGWEPSGEHPF